MVTPQQLGVDQQLNQYKQQFAGAGLSGNALVDVIASRGIIRIKIDVPPDKLEQFINNYTNVIVMSLKSMNLEVKTHVDKGS